MQLWHVDVFYSGVTDKKYQSIVVVQYIVFGGNRLLSSVIGEEHNSKSGQVLRYYQLIAQSES